MMATGLDGEDGMSPRERLRVAYERHAGRLYRHALLISARHAVAQDAVQQAFAKLAAMGGRVLEIGSVEQYLRVAVRNECYRLMRVPRMAAMDGSEAAILEPVDAGLEAEEERRAIEAALRGLPPEQREIVYLKVYEGLTFQEVAEVVGVPLHTAASRYRYAAEKLRGALGCLEKRED